MGKETDGLRGTLRSHSQGFRLQTQVFVIMKTQVPCGRALLPLRMLQEQELSLTMF